MQKETTLSLESIYHAAILRYNRLHEKPNNKVNFNSLAVQNYSIQILLQTVQIFIALNHSETPDLLEKDAVNCSCVAFERTKKYKSTWTIKITQY